MLSFTKFLLVILYLFAKVTNHGRPQGVRRIGHLHGKCKIFVLHLNVISKNHQKFQPSTFQCLAQGTFHANMQSSHFYQFKAFANCFHTLIWKGGSNTSFGLIKGKCIIFILPISSLSLFGQLSLVQCCWQALLSHRHKKHGKFVYPLCCPTHMHKLF